jgi:hypothetical protein
LLHEGGLAETFFCVAIILCTQSMIEKIWLNNTKILTRQTSYIDLLLSTTELHIKKNK